MFMEKNNISIAGFIIGIAMIISTILVSRTAIMIKSNDTVEVTGSAKKEIISDIGKLKGEFHVKLVESKLSDGYKSMLKDENIVKAFFIEKGISENDIKITPVYMNEIYDYDKSSSTPSFYNLSQSVEITSYDVNKIEEISKEISEIIDKGVLYTSYSAEYYYSGLSDDRINLLSDAVSDAKARVEQIAKSTNKKVGSVKEVKMGVVQLMPINSMNVSDYGTYDTSSIDKEVNITVRTVFELK